MRVSSVLSTSGRGTSLAPPSPSVASRASRNRNNSASPSSALGKTKRRGSHSGPATPEPDAYRRETKTCVQVRIAFLKIGEINTLKEQYSAEIFIQAKWREPLLDKKTTEELQSQDLLDKVWHPRLFIDNALSEQKESTFFFGFLNERGEAFVTERRKLRGVFLENLELQHFPFDVQDLSVTVASERPESEVELIPDEDEPSSVNVDTFAGEQEWKLYQHVDTTTKTVATDFGNNQHSALQATCRAARRPGYFYYNVFLTMFFISAISFGIFSVDCSKAAGRLRLIFILILTSITFKRVVSSTLPRISYLTYLDIYSIFSLVYLVLNCIWDSVVTQFCTRKDKFFSSGKEKWIVLAFGVVYLTGHAVFIAFVYKAALRRQVEMARKDREFLEKNSSKEASEEEV